MKQELKDKWIAALMSGDYTQAKGKLERLDNNKKVIGNCCLGVLCRVAGVPAAGIEPTMEYGDGYVTSFDHDEEQLSSDLQEQFGLNEDLCSRLAMLNDGNLHSLGHNLPPATFEEIAHIIEYEVPVQEDAP